MSEDLDSEIFAAIFAGEGASEMLWEQATGCPCENSETHQPEWGCATCGGGGVLFAAPQTIRGLFRSQARELSFRREGELAHGDALLTTPLSAHPGYVDRRVRDRFTVLPATTDPAEGRVFYPAAQAVPVFVADIQRAWRVALQAALQTERLVPQ